LAAIVLAAGMSPAQEPQAKASIEGIVLRAGAGTPLAGARVILVPPGVVGGEEDSLIDDRIFSEGASPFGVCDCDVGFFAPDDTDGTPPEPEPNAPSPPADIQAVTTDGSGRFAFHRLDPGDYRVRVQANGYVSPGRRTRRWEEAAIPLTLTAGQAMSDVTIRMTPAGSIGGRLRDGSGRALASTPVQLLHALYDETGDRHFHVAGFARTNDRGEYRIYWITPGRYYLIAGAAAAPDSFDAVMGLGIPKVNPNEVFPATGMAFYPGVSDFSGAAAIEILPGGELNLLDWTLPPRPAGHRVRGRLIDSATGLPPAEAHVEITPMTPGWFSHIRPGETMSESFGGRNYNPATGVVEFHNVLPGPYVITAQASADSGLAAVTVADSDIDNVVIPVSPYASIAGRFRVDGELPSTEARQNLQVQLLPGAISNAPLTPTTRRMDADGAFTLETVTSGEYHVAVRGLPASGYIKQARLGGVDVLNAPLRWTPSAPNLLEVLIALDGREIQGTIVDEQSQPAPLAAVVLVPEGARHRWDLFKVATADRNGRFTISGAAPGAYKLFAWESIEPNAWFDADLLARSEPKGTPAQVSESAIENVTVRIIRQEAP
jgi:hypothetical protein